jgi:hypothetical protein
MIKNFVAGAVLAASMVALLLNAALAADEGDYAPANILKTNGRLGWMCMISVTCPVTAEVRSVISRAVAADRSAQYLLGLTLLTGDGLPRDRDGGVLWVVKAAEQGEPAAARDIAYRIRNGTRITVDETKVAAALKPAADAGEVEAMRALGPMIIGGRGVKQDPAAGLAMIKLAAEKGSFDAEKDLSDLYLRGAPGVTASRPEALKWLAASARHGNVDAMLNLGYMSMSTPMFTDGEKDSRGTVIAADLVQADFWFRLAARSPYHDNSQIRASIEPKMTTAQMDEAKKLVDAWHPRTAQELKSLPIALPNSSRTCQPMI